MTGVYIAQAIDQARVQYGPAAAKRWLGRMAGVSWVYDPLSAFMVGREATPTPAIRSINTEALYQADLLLAFLPAGVPTIGVPMEIELAATEGKQVVIISDAASWSLQYDLPNVQTFLSWGGMAQAAIKAILAGTPEAPEPLSAALPALVPLLMPTTVSEGAEMPRRGYADDAGLDLVVSETRVIQPGEFVDIPCGVSVELPDWSFGMITGRSSTLRKRALMVNQGIIDAGYRGPMFAGVWNLGSNPAKVEAGERIAQLIILHNGTRLVDPVQVESLSTGTRGHNGFGSTGA